jgi:hypothetical protein
MVVAADGVADDAVGGHDLVKACVIARGPHRVADAAAVGVVPADQGPVRAVDQCLAGVDRHAEDRVRVWA